MNEFLAQIEGDAMTEYLKLLDGKGEANTELMISLFQAVIDMDPENIYGHTDDALAFLPDLYFEKGEYKKARALLEKFVELVDRNRTQEHYHWFQYENYNDIGRIYYLEGDIEKAMNMFERSLKANATDNYKAALGLALCFRRKKDIPAARANMAYAKMLKAIDKVNCPFLYQGPNKEDVI